MWRRGISVVAWVGVAVACAGCNGEERAPGAPAATQSATQAAAEAARHRELERRVIEVVCKQLGVAAKDVSPRSRLAADLRADALDRVELTMEVEEAFNLKIADEDVDRWETVGDVIEYVRAHRR